MPVENEIKLRVADPADADRRITALGYTVLHPRVHEMNVVCDTADSALRRRNSLLRVRTAGDVTTVTFKGPAQDGPHKTREETEFRGSDGNAVLFVFEKLGFIPVFRYEKFRTEYGRDGSPGVITLDETPIGSFLELEGPADWVDRTAGELGFTPGDYIKDSYGALYIQYSRAHSNMPADMVFTK